MKVILISVGNFQEYILYNIKNLLLFGNVDITVITEKEFFPLLHAFVGKIECVDCKNLDDFQFNNISHLDKTFRNGFWHLCSLRLFYLYSFIKKNNITNCVHLENDVLVYENLDNISFNTDKIYAPFDAYNRVIPSFIYIPNYLAFEPIISNYNNQKNDMENLASFDENVISSLPIFPILENYKINKFNQHYNNFNCIFDAAAMGQYLGGVDPRNDNNDTRGFVNETCVIKYNTYLFYWVKNGDLYKPHICIDNTLIPIVNLHIHSKRLYNFMGNNPTELKYIPLPTP